VLAPHSNNKSAKTKRTPPGCPFILGAPSMGAHLRVQVPP
jgi:hypothetical protein